MKILKRRFSNIKILIDAADQLYEEEKITVVEYKYLIENIEKDFLEKKKKFKKEDSNDILSGYLNILRNFEVSVSF